MEPDPAPRSDNDQKLAAELTDWEQALTAARDDAEAQAILAPINYAPADLDAILALVASARTAYTARTTADAARGSLSTDEGAARDSADASYAAFRVVARAVFSDDDDAQTALGLHGRVPEALSRFVSHARSGYAAARDEPYQTPLARRGYTPDRLDALTAEVESLLDADRAHTAAASRAKTATTTRDLEARAARDAFVEFRDIARRVLPPDIRDRLGLG